MPIRATAIRGQLQLWWRATRGAGIATHSELFARHAKVWGSTDRASPVEVEIRDVRAEPMRDCARYVWNPRARGGQGGWRLTWDELFERSPLPYALFPFQGEPPPAQNAPPNKDPAQFIETATFTLRLHYPEALRDDVDAAVWAWVSFGGLGARTRRGCGALFCRELAPPNHSGIEQWFRNRSLPAANASREWPTISSTIFVGRGPVSPVDAWKSVIERLQTFRQGEGVGRNHGQQNRPGRSRYPEPETIRRVTGRRSRQHGRLAHIPDDAFPRAEFGLPIVFHFPPRQGEPEDTVLYPFSARGELRERMASPLILKPLALADGKAAPLILRLTTPVLTGVELKQGARSLELLDTTVVRDSRLATYRDSPLSSSPSGSAIEAFLAHARNAGGYREVRR
jgi:CRISPR-associated protein Cmr1